MQDGSTSSVLTATYGEAGLASVTLTVTDERSGSGPLALPTLLVTRLNRLLEAQGLTVEQDWRSQTHRLRAGKGKFCPLPNAVSVQATRDPNAGWDSPKVVPSPTSTPPHPAVTPAPPMVLVAQPDVAPATKGGPTPPAPEQAVMPKAVRDKWAAIRKAHAKRRKAVAIIGPTGTAKTMAIEGLAHAEGVDFVKFDAGGVIEPGDWFGTMTITEGGTFRFIPSDLLRALTEPGKRILLIDEANRASGRAAVALLPVLDGSGRVTVPQLGQSVMLNPDVMVCMTMNLGSAYMHTDPLDPAFANRVIWLRLDYLPKASEQRLLAKVTPGLDPGHAANLAAFAALVRDAASKTGQHGAVSTRQLREAADLIAVGLDPKAALECALLDGFSDEGGARSEQSRVKVHMAGIAWGDLSVAPATDGATEGEAENE
jgi:MoxR-like ATPase